MIPDSGKLMNGPLKMAACASKTTANKFKGPGKADRDLAVFFQETPHRADEQTADQRNIGRARQHPHADAGGVDLAEAGIEVGERIDHAALQRDARGDACAHR